MPVTVQCAYCGKTFETSNGKAKRNKRHFCSRACFNDGFAWKQEDVSCERCGVVVRRAAWHRSRDQHNFCSVECQTAWQRNEGAKHNAIVKPYQCETCGHRFRNERGLTLHRAQMHGALEGSRVRVNCDQCGKEGVVRWPRSIRNNAHTFCSRECFCKWRSENMRGENSPGWQGGVSSERNAWGSSNAGKAFIAGCRRRDQYTCRRCKKQQDPNSSSLHVHHKASWAKYEALRDELDNGITLCAGCHYFIHSRRGRSLRLKWRAQALRRFGYEVHGEAVQLPLFAVA